MNFGIGKMRPMGHDHIYKYAHSKTISDMSRCCKNYLQDGDSDKNWHYVLPNLTKLTNAFTGLVYSEKMILDLPEVTEATGVISYNRNSPIRFMRLNMPKCTYCHAFAYQHGNGIRTERKFEFVLPNATDLSNFFTECDFFDNAYVKIYAPLCTNWGAAFAIGSSNAPNFFKNCDIDMSACVNGNTLFWGQGSRMGELYYTVDENGNHAFGTGLPAVERRYTTFPNLSNGTSMFLNCQLTKNYTTAILNDLPDWTNDTATHNLTLGIHVDWRMDKELNKILKEVDKKYISQLEVPEVTKDKGWNLTVNWNGTQTFNCVLPPMDDVVLNDYTLPDGYTKVSYLQVNGDYYFSRYFNTEIIPNNETGFYLIGMADPSPYSAGQNGGHYFGTAEDSASLGWRACICGFYWPNKTTWYTGESNQILNFLSYCRLNYKNDRLVHFKNEFGNFFTDNLPEITHTFTTPITVGGLGKNGVVKEHNHLNGKIYRLLITQGTELIRDFVPCLDSTGKPCMRDIINGVDYHNQGSGEFGYGIIE